MIEDAINFFTGFQQSERKRSGLEDLCFKMIREDWFPNTYIYAPRTWTTNVQHLANQQARQGVKRAAVVSYSHGQAAAVAYAEYATSIGIKVDLWIACDPVSRNKRLPRWNFAQFLALSALKKKGKIKVPIQVRRGAYVRQEKDWPYGHDLVATNSHVQTAECMWITHSYGHSEIDESPEFWSVAREELTAWAFPPRPAIPLPEL